MTCHVVRLPTGPHPTVERLAAELFTATDPAAAVPVLRLDYPQVTTRDLRQALALAATSGFDMGEFEEDAELSDLFRSHARACREAAAALDDD